MAAYTAIGDAGASLVALLEDAVSDLVSPDSVVLGVPDDTPRKEPVLALSLVGVTENPHLKHGLWDGADPLVDPSALVLDLRYRLTAVPAHGGERDPTGRTRARHELLGRAMQALHSRAVIDDPDLVGSLAGGPPLHVTLDQRDRTPDHREPTRGTPAVHYLVTPVVVDAEPEREEVRVPDPGTERDDIPRAAVRKLPPERRLRSPEFSRLRSRRDRRLDRGSGSEH